MSDGTFSAGREAGRVDATLEDHSAHLSQINGSIDRFTNEVAALTLQIQRLGDAANADRQTVKVTAAALKDADDARRDKGTQRWTPWQRLIAVVAAVAGAVFALIAILEYLH